MRTAAAVEECLVDPTRFRDVKVARNHVPIGQDEGKSVLWMTFERGFEFGDPKRGGFEGSGLERFDRCHGEKD